MTPTPHAEAGIDSRPNYRQIAVPAVLGSAIIGHLYNAADGALSGLILAMAATLVVGLAAGAIQHHRRQERP